MLEVLKSIDFFSTPPQLIFDKKTKISTKISKMLTILLLTIAIYTISKEFEIFLKLKEY